MDTQHKISNTRYKQIAFSSKKFIQNLRPKWMTFSIRRWTWNTTYKIKIDKHKIQVEIQNTNKNAKRRIQNTNNDDNDDCNMHWHSQVRDECQQCLKSEV